MTDTNSRETAQRERAQQLHALLGEAAVAVRASDTGMGELIRLLASTEAPAAPTARQEYAVLADEGGDHHPDLWYRVEEVDDLRIIDPLPAGHVRLEGLPVRPVSVVPQDAEMVKPDYLDFATVKERQEAGTRLRRECPDELRRMLDMFQTVRGPAGQRLAVVLLSSRRGLVTDEAVNGHTLHTVTCECYRDAQSFDADEYRMARAARTVRQARAAHPAQAAIREVIRASEPPEPELQPIARPSWDPLGLSPHLWAQVPDYLAGERDEVLTPAAPAKDDPRLITDYVLGQLRKVPLPVYMYGAFMSVFTVVAFAVGWAGPMLPAMFVGWGLWLMFARVLYGFPKARERARSREAAALRGDRGQIAQAAAYARQVSHSLGQDPCRVCKKMTHGRDDDGSVICGPCFRASTS